MLRTDLAIDKNEIKNSIIPEVKEGGIKIYKSVENAEKHITVSFPQPDLITDTSILENEIINALEELLPQKFEKILVVGLGNREITPDAIGPTTATRLLATRHIVGEFADRIGLKNLRSVSVVSPNVLGKTGIEAAELIVGIVEKIKPQAVIAVDALASSDISRLFKTIQFCNTGISPGSGVKNSRKEISEKTLGVPTIALGIPTVVDVGKIGGKTAEMVVTPKDVDLLCEKVSEITARALNFFLQPDIEREIIMSLV